MNDPNSRIGVILYGALWAVIVPLLLMLWAVVTVDSVPLPAIDSPLAGLIVSVFGLLLMFLGMTALAVHGGGPPMNAYPPPRYVARGIYRWLSHPIYSGFVIFAAGAAIFYGSPSGLWLVTPVSALVLTALVLGYERPDMQRRFGQQVRAPRIALPADADGDATRWERVSIYALVLLPWLVAYEAIHVLGVPRDAVLSYLPMERSWPVVEWTEAIYASTYVLVLAVPLLVRSRRALRRFAVTGLIATAVITLIYVSVPLIAPPRPFEPTTLPGRLLAFERSKSHTVAAFPAFHFIWPLITAQALLSRGRGWGVAAYVYAFIIAASCLTTGMHSLADVVFAGMLFPALRRYDDIWHVLRITAEKVANSWKEWRFGPVRVINHGFYTGIGGTIGVWLAAWVGGSYLIVPLVFVSIFGLIASAIWAQAIEGSPQLLRPLGYYGGMAGGLLGTAIVALLGVDVLLMLGAFAVAMPWVQAAGRVRCLVQGCCHGGPCHPAAGIRYRHPRSRVTQIAGLAGIPIYPTPLYSILSNLVTGTLLLRLWLLGAAPALVLGLYFILNACARFVEESYRAEPQTPVVARLSLYQWMALAALGLGVVFTTLSAAPAPAPGNPMQPAILVGGLLVGIVGFCVTGVDFPESNRRFSRLAAADPVTDSAKPIHVNHPQFR